MPSSKTVKLTVSAISFCALVVVIISLLWKWWDDLAVASAVLGTVIGWLVGTMLSPYESEVRQFETFAKVISAFVTGFLVSKVDTIFGVISKEEYYRLITNGMVIRRLLIGVTCSLLAMMAVFISRQYYHET